MSNISSFDCNFYNCVESRNMRRDCPYPHVFDSTQQPSRVVVPAGNNNNGKRRPQGEKGGNQ